MRLGPRLLLLLDPHLVEAITRPRSKRPVLLDLRLRPLLLDLAQIGFDFALDAGLFPGFAARRFVLGRFVRFPAAFGQDPAFAGGGLDEEDLGAVCGEGDHAGYQTLAVGTVSEGTRRFSGLFFLHAVGDGWVATSAYPDRF